MAFTSPPFCPLAIFQAADREHARLSCLEKDCAWWDESLAPARCAIKVIAFRLLPLGALDEASLLGLELQEQAKRIRELEERMRGLNYVMVEEDEV